MTLLAVGQTQVIKLGSTGPAVRDLQRTLDAALPGLGLTVDGLFTVHTDVALRDWQHAVGANASGVANPSTWSGLASGLRG
jgi:peptidoglycan hydrolase-like protein with peptidoglycan-binding domain